MVAFRGLRRRCCCRTQSLEWPQLTYVAASSVHTYCSWSAIGSLARIFRNSRMCAQTPSYNMQHVRPHALIHDHIHVRVPTPIFIVTTSAQQLQIPSRSHCHPPHLRTTAQPLSHCTSAPCTQLDDTGQLLMTVEEGQCHPSDGHGHTEKGCLRGESCAGSTEKRNRVVWTRELHACFLDAIKRVGIDLVVPKTILHAMGSPPGVSRESIASHLQKFRIWHRKVKAQGVLDEDLSVDDFLSQRGYEAPHSGTGSMSRRKRQAIMASMSSSGSSLEAGLSSSSSNNNNNNNSLNLTSGVATSGNTDSLPSGAAATAMTFTKNNDQLLAKGSKKKYQTTADKGTKKTDPLNSTAVVIKSDAMRQHLHGRGSNVETPEPAETAAAGAPLVQSSSTTSTASAASVVPMSTSGASPTAIVMVASATTSPSAITHEATGASNKLAGSATTISRPSAGSTTSASGTAVASAPSAISEDRTQTGFPGGVPARSKSGQPTKRLAPSSGGMTRAIVGRAPKVAKAGLLDAALVLTPTALVGPALECEEPTAAQGGLYAGIVSEAAEDDDMAIYDLHSMFVMVEGEDDGGLVGEGVTGHLQEQVAHYPFVDVKAPSAFFTHIQA
eukprot:jgi/Mesvir1/29286/Mv01553-RA.1